MKEVKKEGKKEVQKERKKVNLFFLFFLFLLSVLQKHSIYSKFEFTIN